MNTVGDRIKRVRESLDLTGEEFGNKLNVTKVAVSNWENNNRKPDLDMIVKIADLGDVSTDYLLCKTDNSNSKIYNLNLDGDDIELQIHKDYPHNLSPDEVKELINQLKDVGFDVDKLIEKAKESKKP